MPWGLCPKDTTISTSFHGAGIRISGPGLGEAQEIVAIHALGMEHAMASVATSTLVFWPKVRGPEGRGGGQTRAARTEGRMKRHGLRAARILCLSRTLGMEGLRWVSILSKDTVGHHLHGSYVHQPFWRSCPISSLRRTAHCTPAPPSPGLLGHLGQISGTS